MKITKVLQSIFLIIITCSCIASLETDTISPTLSIKDPETIVSQTHIFKLGFFTPKNSTNRYLAIFYNTSDQTAIWVANRDNPITDSSSIATISENGNLILINAQNQTIWSTNITSPQNTTTAQILDTGNLILRDNATGTTIWNSFSYPSNHYIPTMRLSENINTNKKIVLSSWKNESNPASGNFTHGLKALHIPQTFTWNNGIPHWRSGPWNGEIFIGIKDMYFPYMSIASVMNDSDGSFYFTIPDPKVRTKLELNSSGTIVQTMWDDQRKNWETSWLAPETRCDVYGTCGAFGSCNNEDSPICSCLRGFEPANGEEWGRGNWSSGCKRINQLQCHQNGRDGFLRMEFMKVPDFAEQVLVRGKEECRDICLRNCSCLAYAHDPNIGCMFWRDSLIDMQRFADVGVDLYIRLSASDFDNRDYKKLFIIIPVVVGVVLIILIAWCWLVKRKGEQTNENMINMEARLRISDSTAIILKDESKVVNIKELPVFKFKMIANATNQFNNNNLLGMGGFGSVYKGELANGKEVAVKRLSASSGQGMEEFMNEVILICKLQHRNLVRLLGCCVEKEEKMLVYEYMPNKSLDVYLFHSTVSSTSALDWKIRFSIIEGIARGLLYLHRDSRLRIIHRDLKPSNVLLDEEWNPKISDFGMARIFGGDKDHGRTGRIVGTYGYMSPEYAFEGRFSEKSDVYSFGVLMVEIIKGQKNTHYYNHELSLSLLGCAWNFWREGNCSAFADESIATLNFEEEITRCIQIALLCVQECPNDRPSIQTVLSMLSREI